MNREGYNPESMQPGDLNSEIDKIEQSFSSGQKDSESASNSQESGETLPPEEEKFKREIDKVQSQISHELKALELVISQLEENEKKMTLVLKDLSIKPNFDKNMTVNVRGSHIINSLQSIDRDYEALKKLSNSTLPTDLEAHRRNVEGIVKIRKRYTEADYQISVFLEEVSV